MARLSGDEFAIYIHNILNTDAFRTTIIQRLQKFSNVVIEMPDGTDYRIRFSSGIAWYGADSINLEELIKFADFAMYESKHGIKGSTSEFNQKTYLEKKFIIDNKELINKLIEEEAVRFMYQPIVCLRTGEIAAYEALLRSQLPEFKSPLEILKVATSQYKLQALEMMLIANVLRDAYTKRAQLKDTKVFVNSIASQMIPESTFMKFKEIYGDFMHNIVVEITEEEDNTPEKMKEKIRHIRQIGMEVALDDFGSGYSNELRIISINPKFLKIDMELVQGISESKDKSVLCKNLIDYCHDRGIRVIAEGVEVKEDLEQIMLMGCDYVQGYFMARPNYEIKDIEEEKKEIIRSINKKRNLIP